MSCPRDRIILLPLFPPTRLATDGSTTAVYVDLAAPRFERVLPYAEGLTLYTLTLNRTTNFEWNIVFRSGFNLINDDGSINKLGPGANIVANGSVRHTEFTDAAKFNLEARLQILLKNTSGTAWEVRDAQGTVVDAGAATGSASLDGCTGLANLPFTLFTVTLGDEAVAEALEQLEDEDKAGALLGGSAASLTGASTKPAWGELFAGDLCLLDLQLWCDECCDRTGPRPGWPNPGDFPDPGQIEPGEFLDP